MVCYSSFIYDISLTDSEFTEHEPKMWDDLKGQFMNHLDQVNSDLRAAGLPELPGKKGV